MNLDSPSADQLPCGVRAWFRVGANFRKATVRPALIRAAIMLGLLILVGCASPQIAYSWRGEPADALIAAWGEPTTSAALADGTREIVYTHEETVQFVDFGCAASFQVEPGGIIAEALVEGDQRGCNGLLAGKSAKTGRTLTVGFGLQVIITGR